MAKEKTFLTREFYSFENWPELPSVEVWRDWIRLRAYKRASVTQHVVTMMGKQMQLLHKKYGISPDEALKIACSHGWQGFRADWVEKKILEVRKAGKTSYE